VKKKIDSSNFLNKFVCKEAISNILYSRHEKIPSLGN
jgi:hypothetical protein